jgi:hypothetical protein
MSDPEELVLETSGPELVIQHTGQTLALKEETVTIGAEADNILVLEDPQASPHHAAINWQAEAGTFIIEDLGTTAGTFVNERRVEEPQPLRPGDVIRVADTILTYRLGAEEEEGAAGPPVPPPVDTAPAPSRKPLITAIVVLALAGITIVCLALFALALTGGRGSPEVLIQSPADGTQIAAGTEIILQASVSDANDITLLELTVDDEVVASNISPDPGGVSSLTVSTSWAFGTPGQHLVSAVAHTARGRTSSAQPIRITVLSPGEEVPPGVPTLTPLPTPPPEPEATVPPPTPTTEPEATVPPPPQIEYFQASPTSITAGDCTTLQWGKVSYADQATIEPEVGGVGTPGSQTVCPTETTVYVLTATGRGGETTASTTVTVVGGLPDLTIDTLRFDPLPAVQGQDTEVQITIRNAGQGPAGAFNWHWDAGSEGLFDGRVYGLKAGETTVVSVLWQPAQVHASLNTEARVDTDNEVPESDETNNQLGAAIQVVEAPQEAESATLPSDRNLQGYLVNDDSGGPADQILVGNGNLVPPTGELVARGFMTFDPSPIPSGANIESVELRFYQKAVEGNPYGLGGLVLEHVVYGDSLDASAFDVPALDSVALDRQTEAGAWYVVTDDALARWLMEDLASGRTLQLRLRFSQETDGDGEEDYVGIEGRRTAIGERRYPQLTVTYLP